MTPKDISDRLTADIDAYVAAATAAERQAALKQWMDDITKIVISAAFNADRLDSDKVELAQFRKLLRQLLDRRVIWNPQLRSQL